MERSIQYVEATSNFDSVYNIPTNPIPVLQTYVPLSSSIFFNLPSNRPKSPLFRRCTSPPLRVPLRTESVPKFNFDLYKMNEVDDKLDCYYPSEREHTTSTLSNVVFHHPIDRCIPSPTSESTALSKLREINDELYYTLQNSEPTFIDKSCQHVHIHHYPLSQEFQHTNRSRCPSEDNLHLARHKQSNIHKARVTYRINIPPRYDRYYEKSIQRPPLSDTSSIDDPTVIDLYPTRDAGFVSRKIEDWDSQNPWIVKGTACRRASYSDTSIVQTHSIHKDLYDDDRKIKKKSKSHRGQEHLISSLNYQSPVVTSQIHSGRPHSSRNNSTRHKTIQHTHKAHSSRNRPPLKREDSETTDQPEQLSSERSLNEERKLGPGSRPKHSTSIENKETSTLEPAFTGLTSTTAEKIKPNDQLPVENTRVITPTKTVNDSILSKPHSSPRLDHVPVRVNECTPKRQTTEENHKNLSNLSRNQSQISERSITKSSSVSERSLANTPKINQSESNKENNIIDKNSETPSPDQTLTPQSIKNDVHEKNNQNSSISPIGHSHAPPSPPTEPHSPTVPTDKKEEMSPQPATNESKLNIDDQLDEIGPELPSILDFNKWLKEAKDSIDDNQNQNHHDVPPAVSSPLTVETNRKSPANDPSPTPSEDPEKNLYKPPFGPKKQTDEENCPPITTADPKDTTVDDFFE